MDPEIQTEAFTCRYCGSPTDVDPSDQTSRRLLPRIRSPLVVISSSLPPIRTTSPTTHPISYHLSERVNDFETTGRSNLV